MAESKKPRKLTFYKKDLVALQHHKGGNPICVDLVGLKGALDGLEIDLKNGTWTWTHREYSTSAEIGRARPIADDGFIGVFDRTKIDHLRHMMWAYDSVRHKEGNLRIYII